MSLAELFYSREAIRTRGKRGHGKKPRPATNQFTLESLEPRLLLSATPTEIITPQEFTTAAVTVPAGSLPNLDVDLNGQADALSDGIVIIRHLFGFTGNALVDGAVDPLGQRTDPTAIQNYLNSIGGALDVDLNQQTDALSDGIMIIRSLFGFSDNALTDGAIDPGGQRTDPAVIATFLDNMNPQRELIAPVMTAGLQQDTGLSSTDTITSNPAITGTIADINQIATFTAGFDATPLANYTDILSDLLPNGTFGLSTVRLGQIFGSPLADGTHTLHLRVTDARGNLTTLDRIFTLDTAAPLSPTFDLAITSDTGVLGDQQTTATIVTLKGLTDATTPIQLVGPGIRTLSTGTGTFQLPDLALTLGANPFTFRASDVAGNQSDFSRTITRLAATQQADVVLTWNQVLLEAIRLDATPPPMASRGMAMVSLAMYDVINAIEGTPGYYVSLPTQPGTSADAAAASAAHRVLSYLYPGQQAFFDTQLAASLAVVPDGAAETNGITLGQSIADAIIAIRSQDGWNDFVDYVPGTQPGDWQPTAPMFDVALLPQWADLTPFALTSPNQFTPAGPPALDSAVYAAAFNEVKALGSATGSTRTADQTEIARFWADGSGTYTPPGHWNQIASQIALEQGNSLSANARLFAQLNVALADAGITAWDAKYQYEFWRPITAIHQADLDGNALTVVDPTWSSLLITPPFPEYTSGHSTFSGAAAEILSTIFGPTLAFTTTSLGLPNVQRTFTSFEQAAQEAGKSRIYGGIHFEFSNQDGLASGKALADFVLNRFTVTTDSQAPTILLNQQTGAVTNTNLNLTGQVLDNLSGVAALEAKFDSGAFAPIIFDSTGRFTLPTTLALDGSADGPHMATLQATDHQGHVSTLLFAFTLDTTAPTLTVATPVASQVLAAGDRLIGTVLGTGSAITQLRYYFDNGSNFPVTFDPTTGSFNQELKLSELGAGSYLLTMEAQDAAGNTATTAITVTLSAPIPFVLERVTPEIGAGDMGTTFRPQIFFSRPVEPASLTNNNFYATGPDGEKLPAVIVPSQDGTFAWLFFNDPMPGGSQVTVHMDGASIRALSDGQFLDADNNGQPGGIFEYSFSTVSLTPVPGTTLSGRVVDPGPDLTPMTFDDIRVGPDGILHTGDDVFLNPLAGVKVFILGLEDQAVFTNAEGRFSFDAVPVGNVKVAIDGRTATNGPSGFYFPEMVMDATLRVGEANRLMGTMGTLDAQEANATRDEVYLPRLRTAILQQVSDSQATTVGVLAAAAPDLTSDQRSQLTLEIQPGSLIGPDGAPLTGAMVGLSTVPPELVRDMLPPGLLQHTFDITIQAPDAVAFATPAVLTFPNVFNAAPGTQLNFLSFDHTTGRLVIEGTATVSADGLTVTTDPGTGITKPGWHGMTPPGSDGCGGDAPSGPVGGGGAGPASASIETAGEIFPAASVVENRLPPVALSFITADVATTDFATKTWGTDQSDQCEENAQGQSESPTVNVRITVDGPLARFMKPIDGGLPLINQSFNIRTTGGGQKTFGFVPKTYDEILGSGGFTNLNTDRLYGAKITITETRPGASGTFVRDISTYYQYRWIDVVDAAAAMARAGDTAVFHRTFADGLGNVVREKDVDHFVGPYDHLFTHQANLEFDLGPAFRSQGTTGWTWDPFVPGAQTLPTDVMVFDQGTQQLFKVGVLQVKGTATGPSKLNLNLQGFGDELRRVVQNLQREAGPDGNLNTSDDRIFYHQSDGDLVASDRFKAAFAQFLPGQNYTQQDLDLRINIEADAFQAAVRQDYQQVMDSSLLGGTSQGYEFSSFQPDPLLLLHETVTYGDIAGSAAIGVTAFADSNFAVLEPIVRNALVPQEAKEWALAEILNVRSAMETLGQSPKVSLAKVMRGWSGAGLSFGQAAGIIASHELGHALGLKDAYLIGGLGDVQPLNDIMNTGHMTNDVGFTTRHTNLLLASLGLHAGQDSVGTVISFNTLSNELTLFKLNFFNPDPNRYGTLPATAGIDRPALSLVHGGQLLFPGDRVLLPATAVDGPLGVVSGTTVSLRNDGTLPLIVGAVGLFQGGAGLTLTGPNPAGTTLAPGESRDITILFDPEVVGLLSDRLRVASNDAAIPFFDVVLEGNGIQAAPTLAVASVNNNLGGALVSGDVVTKTGIFTLRNDGAQTLTITDIRMTEGFEVFSLTGLPANLATNPIQLATGQTLSFGATFDPDHVGLHRGIIEVLSNDPQRPVMKLSVVGTGVEAEAVAQWGNDFVAIEPQDLPGSIVLRATSNDQGRYGFFLGPKQLYHQVIFDPETGLVSHSYPTTSASGGSRNLSSTIVFEASTAPDSDFDGLADDVEFAVGTALAKTDTDSDGLSDFSEVQQGLDPLGGQQATPGTVGAVSLNGTGEAVVVYPSSADQARALAYVATAWDGTVRPQFLNSPVQPRGFNGLTIVDVTTPSQPALIGALSLGGTVSDVDVDPALNLAAVTDRNRLHIVDVSDPSQPVLLRTMVLPDGASAVAVRDGFAYVAGRTELVSVDLVTGEIIRTLSMTLSRLTDVAIEGAGLFTMDQAATLSTIELLGAGQMTARGSLVVTGTGGDIFVGNGIAYMTAAQFGPGGFATADVRDLGTPVLLSLSDVPINVTLAKAAFSADGSGLGLLAGTVREGVTTREVLDVMNVTDPTDTFSALLRIPVIGIPESVTTTGGFAVVASTDERDSLPFDRGYLSVVQYRSPDLNGVAPTVALTSTAVDIDPGTAGLQVLEGGFFVIGAQIVDDVQVRSVELLVNNQVVTTDLSFPWDLIVRTPTVTAAGATLLVRARVTDTGGNVALSNELQFNVVRDTVAPVLLAITPADGTKPFVAPAIDLQFNEGLDETLLNPAGAVLVARGADGQFDTPDDSVVPVSLILRNSGRLLSVVPNAVLTPGTYRLTVDPAIVADKSGNRPVQPPLTAFTIRAASDIDPLSGAAAFPDAPAANPGQIIPFVIPGITSATAVTFPVIDDVGLQTTRAVTPVRTDAATNTGYYVVPNDAVTGNVTIPGDPDGPFQLQIVPVLTTVDLEFVSNTDAFFSLTGRGFIEGNNTQYLFGSIGVTDTSPSTGPDVSTGNGEVFLNTPFSDDLFGDVRVKTAGGISAPFSVGFAALESIALSGTPADPTQASANPGQVITLRGVGLSLDTDIVAQIVDDGGVVRPLLLNPFFIDPTGTMAQVAMTSDFNGAFAVNVVGSSFAPVLQIVPVVSGFDTSNFSNLLIMGQGFVEDSGSLYQFAGLSLPDTSAATGPNVSSDGELVVISLATLGSSTIGFGPFTVTTAGGTSAPVALPVLYPGQGLLQDVAFDTQTGHILVVDAANITRVNPATGAAISTIPLPGESQSNIGLSVLTTGIPSLGGTPVPAGHLLLTFRDAGGTRMVAVHPTTGEVTAGVAFPNLFFPRSGLFYPGRETLFLAESDLYEIDPATGTVLRTVTVPPELDFVIEGMAVDPITGRLWLGSDSIVLDIDPGTGATGRVVELQLQGIDNLSGLAFDGSGALLVSIFNGPVAKASLNDDLAQPTNVTVSGIPTSATAGLPADSGVASANVGQMIELTGTGFGPGSQVVFPTRNAEGVTGLVAVSPSVVSQDGTRLQVRVPNEATTGAVTVQTVGNRNLGFDNSNDAIYRNVTMEFTAGGTGAVIRFADEGLGGLTAESWGLDNVMITPVAQPGTVIFADDFEPGAKPQWSDATTDATLPGVFSRFSGRFNGEQQLTVNSLTAGQTYHLSFDLYVIGNWSGIPPFGSPDFFDVFVDGQRRFHESFSNDVLSLQTYSPNIVGDVPLQIVPLITRAIGRPGTPAEFQLSGSGFMEGASTITVNGFTIVDRVLNDNGTGIGFFDAEVDDDDSDNGAYRLVLPFVAEGPLSVSTAGGSHQIPMPVLLPASPVQFSGIAATAQLGNPANPAIASANTGQSIILQGSGFTSGTLVQFDAVDDRGVAGTLTRTGTVGGGGQQLTVEVPAMATTGMVRVVGSDQEFFLQIVPTLRAIGGVMSPGSQVVLEGTGLTQGNLTVRIGGRVTGAADVQMITDSIGATATLDQQLALMTVPTGLAGNTVQVTTAGGFFTLPSGSITAIAAVATGGTPARGTLPSANVGQTITLSGTGFLPADQVVFTGRDAAGNLVLLTATPTVVAADGTSLEVVVPTSAGSAATTGMVRLARETSGLLLQVVPTLSTVTASPGGAYHGGSLTLTGTGFDEGVTAIHFADEVWADASVTLGRDVSANNTSLTSGVPTGAAFGPIFVSTLGGTSVQFTVGVGSLTATASSGTPANGSISSANPGQVVTLSGSGLTLTTSIVFQVMSEQGVPGERAVRPLSVNAQGSVATLIVPDDAVTGTVSVIGDAQNNPLPLQIVPIVTGIDLTSVNGTTLNFTLSGRGFIDEEGTIYRLGQVNVIDQLSTTGPDVFTSNTTATISAPFSDQMFGQVTVQTKGGTSAPFTVGYQELSTVAYQGTPADSAKPSANAGQAVIIRGTGLTPTTDLVSRFIDPNTGTVRLLTLNPSVVNAAGTEAVILLPASLNGAFPLNLVGSAVAPVLQIVPVVNLVSPSTSFGGPEMTLEGTGFVEANGTRYTFAGGTVTDIRIDFQDNPDVVSETSVVLPVPTGFGFGPVTVTSSGGTSHPVDSLILHPAFGGSSADIAFNAATGEVLVINGGQIVRVNPATGSILGSFAVPGSVNNFGGTLQIITAPIPSLGGTAVPAGSLLVVSHDPSPDKVFALDPVTGTVLASVTTTLNTFPLGGLFHPGRGTIFVLDENQNRLFEVNPADGTLVGSRATPDDLVRGGLALDPVSGNLWLGSLVNTSDLVEVDPATGAVVRRFDLSPQLKDLAFSADGLAFHSDGDLLVMTPFGSIGKVDLGQDPAQPTDLALAGMTGTALDGTPANGILPSANVGQILELTGTGFGPLTQVLFHTRDNNGVEGLTAVLPMAVNAEGTRLQVVVPGLATTGPVTVRATGAQELSFDTSGNEAIYRNVTVDFTAGAGTATVLFTDEGLEANAASESWGLDNVMLSPAASPGTVLFSDTFEGGAKSEWKVRTTNKDGEGLFTEYSGRFNNTEQQLTLSGLTPGTAYRLSFDLYILGSWDGLSATNGPDFIDAFVDGQRLFHEAFSNQVTSLQTFTPVPVAEIPLQIVPVIKSLSGRPGLQNFFTMAGSGYMEGASTVTIGGASIVDRFVNDSGSGTGWFDGNVTGTTNGSYVMVLPLAVEGPVQITTAGGSHSLAGPAFAQSPPIIVTSIQTTALQGTPANALLPSANTGQSITLLGSGFTGVQLVQFEAVDEQGVAGVLTRSGSLVNNNGTELRVEVPALARSGKVRVLGVPGEFDLQIVPTLRARGGAILEDNQILLEGTGLVEGAVSLLIDGQTASGLDVLVLNSSGESTSVAFLDQEILVATVPAGVGTGTIQVVTTGGSFTLAPSATSIGSITSAATAGIPARDGIASANTGQTITLTGAGFLSTDRVVFTTVNSFGQLSTTAITLASVAGDGTSLTVVVPATAASGMVRLERENTGLFLQIVPILADVVGTNGGSFHGASLTLTGGGFIEGDTRIAFGNQIVLDRSGFSGLDVGANNATISLVVPSGVPTGPITVNTFGGTSTPFGLTFTGITSIATSGTPNDSGQASANPGQSITLTGTGFDTTTDIIFLVSNGSTGVLSERIVRPLSVTGGTQLTVTVPNDAITGTVSIAGEQLSAQILLQIVPRVNSLALLSGGAVRVSGQGLIEGNGTVYEWAGVRVTDYSVLVGPNVTDANNTTVDLPRTVHGAGPFTVRTAGGTSIPVTVNHIDSGLIVSQDVAFNAAAGELLVADQLEIYRIDPATGQTLGRYAIPSAPGGFDLIGVQVLPAPIPSLGGTAVPAGSLLVSNRSTPERIFAVNPITGSQLAAVVVQEFLQAVGAVYHPTRGTIFLLSSFETITEINPATGATIASFPVPFTVERGGLAVDPVSGNIWAGSHTQTSVTEFTPTGTVVRTVGLSGQGLKVNEQTGLAFHSDGSLLVSATVGSSGVFGLVYKFTLPPSPASAESLSLSTTAASLADATTSTVTSSVVVNDAGLPTMDLSLAYVQRSWVKEFVSGSAGATDGEDEELLIALPG